MPKEKIQEKIRATLGLWRPVFYGKKVSGNDKRVLVSDLKFIITEITEEAVDLCKRHYNDKVKEERQKVLEELWSKIVDEWADVAEINLAAIKKIIKDLEKE